MYVYKITNLITGKWYIGKHNGTNPNYMGSGILLKRAIKKHGVTNFKKEILEVCSTIEELNLREAQLISEYNAVSSNQSYNMVAGGEGGDRSKFIPYDKIDRSQYKMTGTSKWFQSLSSEEKHEFHAKQGKSRSKGWYISPTNDPSNETFILNIAEWCRERGIDTSIPSKLNDPKSAFYLKQTNGWRIRRSDMPPLPPFIDNRHTGHPCSQKGKGWKLINGKRVYYDK